MWTICSALYDEASVGYAELIAFRVVRDRPAVVTELVLGHDRCAQGHQALDVRGIGGHQVQMLAVLGRLAASLSIPWSWARRPG
jgi:hypothetical protein